MWSQMNKCQINVVSIENFLHEQVSNKQASNKCALKWVVPVWKGSNEMASTVSIQTYTAIYSIFKTPIYSTWSLQKNKKYWNELVCNISCLLKYTKRCSDSFKQNYQYLPKHCALGLSSLLVLKHQNIKLCEHQTFITVYLSENKVFVETWRLAYFLDINAW